MGEFETNSYQEAEITCGELKQKIEQKKQAWKRYIKTKEAKDKIEYTRLRNESKITVRDAKRRSWEKLRTELSDEVRNNNRTFQN